MVRFEADPDRSEPTSEDVAAYFKHLSILISVSQFGSGRVFHRTVEDSQGVDGLGRPQNQHESQESQFSQTQRDDQTSQPMGMEGLPRQNVRMDLNGRDRERFM